MTGSDSIEVIPNSKVKSNCALHLGLQPGNWQAKCSGKVVESFRGSSSEMAKWG